MRHLFAASGRRTASLLFCAGAATAQTASLASPRAQFQHTHHVAVLRKPARQAKGKTRVDNWTVYIGTYTTEKNHSKGIYIYQMNAVTGKLTLQGTGPQTASPSFLAIAPDHHTLFAANEISDFEGTMSGAVSAFAIDPQTHALTFLNQQSSHGGGPCFVSVDAQGKNVLVANYGSGSIACLPVQSGGKLGEATTAIQHEGMGADKSRQEGPHAHSINLDAANHFAIAADLGLDKLFVYKFDADKGLLTPNDPPFTATAPAAGPRHFVFHSNGHFAYAINELNSTVTAYRYDAQKGTLTPLQSLSTLPAGFKGTNSTAEVQLHPNGKFLYGSNRGHNSIATFAIDQATGHLKLVGHESTQGKIPRNFRLDPTGTYLLAANQDTDNVVAYHIDPKTGLPKPTGESIKVPSPVCIKFLAK